MPDSRGEICRFMPIHHKGSKLYKANSHVGVSGAHLIYTKFQVSLTDLSKEPSNG